MKKKVSWLLVSCLMVVALVLASCAPTPAPTPTPTPTPTPAPTPTPTPTPSPAKEEPKYGGTFTIMHYADISRGFDPYRYGPMSARHLAPHCLEGLGTGDWARGPGGTNEWPFVSPQPPLKYTKGNLAESWEISPDGLTYTFHLRKGIRWQNKPPVNGRELVASDVKYCYDRLCGIGSGFTAPSPYNSAGTESLKEITIPDKYTVVFKCSKFDFSLLPTILTEFAGEMYPPECTSLPRGLDDWRNVCGTGPFILIDHVPASSLTFKRNPDYWGYDEFHPKNQLPYFDTFKSLVVPDISTRLAAMRSSWAEAIGYEYPDWRMGEGIKKTNPEVQLGVYNPGGGTCLYLRHDVKPLDDLRVRKALQMSLDRLAINEIVGAGRCEPYISTLNTGFGPDFYTPFEELPKNVQEVLTYNPEKAKQLLAEAGYPNGFKLEVVVGTGSRHVEKMPIVADYFGRIGVQLDIQVKDIAVHDTLVRSATYSQACAYIAGSVGAKTYFPCLFGSGKWMRHNDQVGEDMWTKAASTVDETKRNKLFKELNYYTLENVYFIGVVVEPPLCSMAQPWVRGWHGEAQLRRNEPASAFMHAWLDLDMKQAVTGKR